MTSTAVISAANDLRLQWARAWLETRVPGEEVLIVGASLETANELARERVSPSDGT